MKMTLLRPLFFVIVASLLAQPGIAADEEEEKGDPIQDYYLIVEGVSETPGTSKTATKISEEVEHIPASVSVVESSLFRVQDAVYLGDAIKNVSGVNVLSGFGTFDFFNVRGFDSLSSVLILTDGAPEPESTFYQLYNVERVEVFKGPGAFLYGGNPLSGTVNLVRKQPVPDKFMHLYNSFGSFGTYRGNVDFNYSNTESNLGFRFNGLWDTSNNYRNDKDSNDVAVNPAFTWQINSQSNLRVNFEYVHNEYQPDSGIPLVNNEIPAISREVSYQSPFDKSDQDIYRTRIDYDAKINQTFTIRNKFYSTVLDWISNGTLISGAFPDGTGSAQILRVLTLLDDRQHLIGNQLEAVASFKTGGVEHSMVTGFEVTRLSDQFNLDVALLPTIDLLNPVETAREPLFFIPGQSAAADARSMVYAPYIVDQMKLSDQFRVLVGARYDILDFKDELSATSRSDNKVSPMFGAVYSPVSNVSLYFNFGQAFAPASTTVAVADDRRPEESTQYEGGLKTQFLEGKMLATFAVYHVQRDNIGIPDANGVTRQNGDQRSQGFEVEVNGIFARSWNASVAYAYNDAELTRFSEVIFTNVPPFFFVADRTGNDPGFAPRHILNGWVTKTFRNGIGIGGGPRYVSSQFIDEDNAFKIDGYVTWDAAGFYDYNHWRFSLNFKNLTDKKYETRGFGPFSVIPASPFAIYGSVDFRL